MEQANQQPDMAQFFDFGQASMAERSDLAPGPMDAHPTTFTAPLCPSHPNSDCLCHGFLLDSDTTNTVSGQTGGDGFTEFSSWIPRYMKPEHACTYCRSKRLECFIIFEGQKSCSPCSALFRPCSFTQTNEQEDRSNAVMDTLHAVNEDVCQESGALTGAVALRSFIDPRHEESDRTGRKSGIRFSRAAVKILKDWLDEHSDHPYPTDEEKDELKLKTGLKSTQISNWLANARRRGKVRPKRSASPSLTLSSTSAAINIPARNSGSAQQSKDWDLMNPLERWQHSPPENEPASVSDIAHAVATTRYNPLEPGSLSGSQSGQHHNHSEGSSCFSLARAPSTTSLETRLSGISSGSLSVTSGNSAWSYGSRNSFSSFGSNAKKDRRRRRRPALRPCRNDSGQNDRIFQCTFCTDTFKSKYDWSRHEKSLHLSLGKWICAPLGDTITCSASGLRKCVYCDTLDPTKEHLELHNHRACEEKGLEARTFYRKDHLRQHLRLMHGCKLTDSMESWKSEATYINCRCGFCGQEFDKWQDRVDHIAKHYRNGATMKDWKGCRGLDVPVAAMVTNAMPPYLIASEAKSPVPFSASNESSLFHNTVTYAEGLNLNAAEYPGASWAHSDMFNEAGNQTLNDGVQGLTIQDGAGRLVTTCWEILTLRLGHFVKQQLELGHGVTDELLQRQARVILYGDDDPWNQTAADNPEWLELFKKAHGVSDDPNAVIDRADLLQDLGVVAGIEDMSFDHFFNQQNWGAVGENSQGLESCLSSI